MFGAGVLLMAAFFVELRLICAIGARSEAGQSRILDSPLPAARQSRVLPQPHSRVKPG
jgi:hypothetical protein